MVTPQSGSSELDKLLDQTAFAHTTFDEGKGPSATQPLPDVFRRRVLQVQRRFTNERRLRSIRQPNLPVSLDNSGVRVLRKDVLDVINIRLERAGISTKTIPEAFFAWMLPRNNANATDWNLLVNCPVFLSNIRLRQMFKMHRSTGRTEAEPGETLFYVRTFAFTLEEFTDLIQAMFEEGFGSHDAPYQLLELLQDLDPVTDAGTTIYIRYCGTTTQGSAWERHEGDLRNMSGRDTSMRSIFFRFCQRMFPHVMDAVELDEFPDATLYGELDSYRQHTIDVREQALIALFGPTTLLNMEKGGLNAKFIAHETENTAIGTLNTSLLDKLPWFNKPFPDFEAIRRYSQEVQDYAQSHPATTNTARYPIDDNVKDLIYNAAIPAMVGNFSIMVTIGSDLTPDAIKRLRTWYAGGIASADLTVDIFDDLARTELGYSHLQSSFVADMHQKKQLPFVDLYPWAKKEATDLNKALELLRMYLQAVKPIVVLTLGDLVSGVGVGSFHQQRGIKSARIIEVLGTPGRSKFDEDVLDKADDNCCVVIPCFHPGSVRQSAVRGELVIRVREKIPGKNTRRKVLTIGTTLPGNAVVDVEEPEDRDLEDMGREQILGDHGELVDEDSEQEEERAALAAERQQAVRGGKEVSETMASSSRPLPSSGGMMPTGDPFTREEVRAAAAEREEINRLGYSGFNPMATSTTAALTTAASSSTTKRARDESDSEDQPGKAKKLDRKRSPSPKKHAGTGAKEKDEDDDEEMLV